MRCIVGAMMVIFLMGGIALLWIGLLELLKVIRRRPHLLVAEGVILKVERKVQNVGAPSNRMRSNNIAHYPVIQFWNQAGERVSFRSEVGDMGEESSYHTGQTLQVLYDPEGHLSPRINSWSGLWFVPLSVIMGGFVFIAGSALIWVGFGDRILGR